MGYLSKMTKAAWFVPAVIAVAGVLIFSLSTLLSSVINPIAIALGSKYNAKLDTAKGATYMSAFERFAIYETNRFRNAPLDWCREVNLGGGEVLEWALENNESHPPLYPTKGLWLASKEFAERQTAEGNMFHSFDEVNKYGGGAGAGQNCGPWRIIRQASGPAPKNPASLSVKADDWKRIDVYDAWACASRLINEMVRDRGVEGKGHRLNAFNAGFQYIGVGIRGDYVTMNFAGPGWKDY